MNKKIGIAAAIIIAAVLAIYLLGGSSESSVDRGSAAESSETKSDGTAANNRPGQDLPRPLRMAGDPPRASSAGPEYPRTYVREDGTIVRDHRSSAVSEEVERRVTLPKTLSPVQPETLAAVRGALRPGMQRCIKAHAPDAPEGSSAQAVLTVSIVDEALTVDALALSTEGLAEDEALKACINEVMLGHQQVVVGAKDVDSHTMTFPYHL